MAHDVVAATRRLLHEWARTPLIALLPGGSAAARGCAQTAKTAEPASRMGTYAAGWAAKELRPPFLQQRSEANTVKATIRQDRRFDEDVVS
jgi:hypothetical protein